MTHFYLVEKQIESILHERHLLIDRLEKINSMTVFPSDSNFFLMRTKQTVGGVFTYLMDNGILVRNLSTHPKLYNCLRVTVGTKYENERFLTKIEDFYKDKNLKDL